MALSMFKARPISANKVWYEYIMDSSNDLIDADFPDDICAGSIVRRANGLGYALSPAGTWDYITATLGGSADALGQMPHLLTIAEGENSTLAVEDAESAPVADGALLYLGDELTVTYSADTGYDIKCYINGVEAGESPDTYTVGLCDDIAISTVATIKTFELSITEGENSTVTVTSGEGDSLVTYSDGDMIDYGTELTITATADTGYNVSTFTVNTVNKTGSNPDTHSVAAAVAVVSAATIKTYTLTLTQGSNTTLTVLDGETPVTTGASVEHGTVLTVSAEAGEGHDLTTFTIGGEDSLDDNPTEHTMVGAVTIVTAATEQG